jgi:[ribosomal protein S5]-alanine N-acetyltransferase
MMIETRRLQLQPLSYDELGLLLDERPTQLGEISLADLKEDDIPRRLIEINRDKMAMLPIGEHIWCTCFLMINRGTLRAVGSLGFKGVPVDGEVEVGYGTAETCQGQGYMGEALAGLLDWANETGQCRKVVADAHVDNIASQRVLLKCGFSQVGVSGEMLHFEKGLG